MTQTCGIIFKNILFSQFRIFYKIIFFCLIFILHNAESTSVLGVSLEDMLNNSDFVFEGQVINVKSRWTNNRNNIHTFITFEIIDVIKGNYKRQQIELSFAGGTVDGVSLNIGNMHFPELGEKGIYFVESLSRTQVNPLYGWSQGHLLIMKDDAGVDRVTTERKKPVMAVEPPNKGRQQQLSRDFAAGLVVGKDRDYHVGMAKTEFIRGLRAMLNRP